MEATHLYLFSLLTSNPLLPTFYLTFFVLGLDTTDSLVKESDHLSSAGLSQPGLMALSRSSLSLSPY